MPKVKDIPWQTVDAICADNECVDCPLRDKEKNKCMPYKSEYAEHEVEGVDKYLLDNDPHGYLFVDQIIKKEEKNG